jgi:hypothetical protein
MLLLEIRSLLPSVGRAALLLLEDPAVSDADKCALIGELTDGVEKLIDRLRSAF